MAQAQVSISDGGTPTYSVGIKVPPGVAGMAPIVGLAYSGGSLDGPVGIGWSLQGISTITRCPASVPQDGAVGGVVFGPHDRLCLDGQRLIQTNEAGQQRASSAADNGANYDDAAGVPASTYREFRTEKDSFARIRAYGSAGNDTLNGPAYFKVWTKSGQVYEYGAASNSASNASVSAQGKTRVMVWAVSRISDTLGNYIDFNYNQRDTAWGSGPATGPQLGREWNLMEIQYTGKVGGQAPLNRVVFDYADREATGSAVTSTTGQTRAEAYQQGSKNISIRRLQAVRTYVNSPSLVPVSIVKLGYSLGANTGHSLLGSITECTGANESICQPAVRFEYTPGGDQSFAMNPNFALSGGLSTKTMLDGTHGAEIGDFNGDGKADILRWGDSAADNEIWFSDGTGSFTKSTAFNLTSQSLFSSNGCYISVIADFNADGRADILRIAGSNGQTCSGGNLLFLGNGDGSFQSPVSLLSGIDLSVVNEVFAETRPSTCGPESTAESPGCPFTHTKTAGKNFHLLDVDGDGFLDIVTAYAPATSYTDPDPAVTAEDLCATMVCTRYYKGSSAGTFSAQTTSLANHNAYSAPPPKTAYAALFRPAVADVDADGLADLTVQSGVWTSQGNGNFTRLPWGLNGSCATPIDFNGDGRLDCLNPQSINSSLAVMTGAAFAGVASFNLTGAGYELWAQNTNKQQTVGTLIADFNGDGRSDILRWEELPSANALYLSNGDGTFRTSISFNLTGSANTLRKADGTASFLAADFTGRGALELLRLVSNPTGPGENNLNVLYLRSNPIPPDMLSAVVSPTGLRTTLAYVPLTNSASGAIGPRYTPGAMPAYPKINVAAPIYVVATVTSQTGVAGNPTIASEYTYEGLRAEIKGHGLLGFARRSQQGIGANGDPTFVVTDYLQDSPYIGVASVSRTYRGSLYDSGSLLSRTTSAYCDKTSPTDATPPNIDVSTDPPTPPPPCAVPATKLVQRPYVRQIVEEGRDLVSQALPRVTTTNQYNDYGDPTQISITTVGTASGIAQTFTKNTANTYQAPITSGDYWILGRLQRATQTNTIPNSLGQIATVAGNALNAAAIQGTGAPPAANPPPPLPPAILMTILQLLLND